MKEREITDTVYECEHCGKVFADANECGKHEEECYENERHMETVKSLVGRRFLMVSILDHDRGYSGDYFSVTVYHVTGYKMNRWEPGTIDIVYAKTDLHDSREHDSLFGNGMVFTVLRDVHDSAENFTGEGYMELTETEYTGLMNMVYNHIDCTAREESYENSYDGLKAYLRALMKSKEE